MIAGAVVVAAGVALAAISANDKTVRNMFDKVMEFIHGNGNRICRPVELSCLSDNTDPGLELSMRVRLSRKYSNFHVLLVAPSGRGKTFGLIIPNVNHLRGSIIVTDPVGEVRANYKGNKRVHIFNPFNDKTCKYNPLALCRNEFDVRKVARTIMMNGSTAGRKDVTTDHTNWQEMATQLFTSYMLYCHSAHYTNFRSVIREVCTLPIMPLEDDDGNITQSLFTRVMSGRSQGAKDQMLSFTQVLPSPVTLASIRNTLNSCLQVFMGQNMDKILSGNDIDFRKFRTEESILFIQIPERHSEYFAPLTATLMTQIIDILLDTKGMQTYIILDEFANVGAIPDITKLLSTARKHRLSVCAAIQSINQLKEVYGDIKATSLQEMFQTIMCTCGLRGSADVMRELMGVVEVQHDKSEITETLPLMTSDQIRRMDEYKLIILHGNKRPVMDDMIPEEDGIHGV